MRRPRALRAALGALAAALLIGLLGADFLQHRARAEGNDNAVLRATVAVSERYTALRTLDSRRRPVDAPQGLGSIRLPFRSVVEGLLRHAGFDMARDGDADVELRITIDAAGTTRGQLYDAAVQGRRIRELRYSDASVAGRIRFVHEDRAVERDFAGEVAPAVTIIGIVDGGDPRRDPVYAPFRQAFEMPGGFLDALGALTLDMWGEQPLRAALGDRDPLVREAAHRALAAAH